MYPVTRPPFQISKYATVSYMYRLVAVVTIQKIKFSDTVVK